MNKKLAAAIAAVVIVGGGVAASLTVANAQTSTTQAPSTGTDPQPPDHPDRGEAQKSALDPLVADGTITQEQEDKVLSALEAAHPKGPGGPGGFGELGRGLRADFDAIAKALNLSTDELQTQLKDGKTIAEIATAQGVDVNTVIQAITDAANAHLDQAVADGKLTQEQADKIKADETDWITKLVNGDVPFGGGHGGFGGHGPGHDDPSGTTTTTTN